MFTLLLLLASLCCYALQSDRVLDEGEHNMVVNVLAVNDNEELSVIQGADGMFDIRIPSTKNKTTTPTPRPGNCKMLLHAGNTISGWYTVYTKDGTSIRVYCDMDTADASDIIPLAATESIRLESPITP